MAFSLTQTWMEEETQNMRVVWSEIINDVTKHVRNLNVPDIDKWLEKVLQYNVSEKNLHGLIVIYAYKSITPNEQQTENNIHLARILAWCMEMAIAYIVMLVDIVDQSLFRRGQPCWYRRNDTGLMAINDGSLVQSTVYYLIEKHFEGKECYNNLVKTFQQAIFKTQIGQFLDLTSTFKKCNLDQFTMERFNAIAKCKTEHGIYFLPTLLAMHFAEIKDPEMFKQAESILVQLGYLYQVQDDYLDCFGDLKVLGKDDTDIKEGKCTWLFVKALQRVTPEQRNILKECYGVSDPEKIRRVKQLYIDLDLPNIYLKYEKETYNNIKVKIQEISCGFPQGFFLDLLRKSYRRRECLH